MVENRSIKVKNHCPRPLRLGRMVEICFVVAFIDVYKHIQYKPFRVHHVWNFSTYNVEKYSVYNTLIMPLTIYIIISFLQLTSIKNLDIYS